MYLHICEFHNALRRWSNKRTILKKYNFFGGCWQITTITEAQLERPITSKDASIMLKHTSKWNASVKSNFFTSGNLPAINMTISLVRLALADVIQEHTAKRQEHEQKDLLALAHIHSHVLMYVCTKKTKIIIYRHHFKCNVHI